MDAPYAKLEQLEPGIARVLAHNPSAFTYYGTQTYFIGEREVAVIDPGPDLPEHVDALVASNRRSSASPRSCARTRTAITALHRGRSPSATGAPIIGCAPLALETVGPRADASFDGDYVPDECSPMAKCSRWTASRSPPSQRRATRRTISASPMTARCSPAIM